MSIGGSSFIVAIVLICTAGWIINNWIRARHGYPLENEWGGTTPKVDVDAERKITLLTNENESLNGKIGNLEERIAVLERIVTDKAGRLSEEIEKLR
ncbi:hypothetical protein [Sphingorhabdus contaminans]|uniref:Uncharacterized protein n=1 Tax=Sphingorhabdus contaminans TaxID=1343899 RepID=A0A553WIA5_9SPHN|nr:hypothetical protein [Sphingorhabdus contaminans]TSB04421.1 hypothetical protein FOM92_03070 [Sphingorhabdus contaminans]